MKAAQEGCVVSTCNLGTEVAVIELDASVSRFTVELATGKSALPGDLMLKRAAADIQCGLALTAIHLLSPHQAIGTTSHQTESV